MSQSPSTGLTPTDEEPTEYLNALTALGNLLASGRSLSGRERNCCFLNTRTARFADVSAVVGVDFPDDARGLSIVDWDGDGDLDAWVTNRTGPRVRLLKNDYHSGNHFITVKLQGTACNRDAVGARVEVSLPHAAGRLVKSLRAGEGYLAQSAKQLHFGLADETQPVDVVVEWPGGQRERFPLMKVDHAYRLVQGSGRPSEMARGTVVQLASSEPRIPPTPAEKRIVLPARLPMPAISFLQLDGSETSLVADDRPTLINLWATWCQPCLLEISEWTERQQQLEAAGVRVLLLSVDGATPAGKDVSPTEIVDLLKRLQAPFPAGIATNDTLDRLDVTQQVLTKRIRSLPVPSSFLVDAQGRLAVLYKGRVKTDQLLEDVSQLAAPEPTHRDLAVPFSGRWYTNPFPPDLLAIPDSYRKRGQPTLALDYIQQHLNEYLSRAADPTTATLPQAQVAEMLIDLGLQLQQQGDLARVRRALEAATRIQPNDVKPRMALSMIYQQSGLDDLAVEQYRAMLRLRPGDPVISNNLAWLLATSADKSVRSPQEAIQLAEAVCAQSDRKFAPALDTLAAAFAASNDFARAEATAREALSLMQPERDAAARQKLQDRLRRYQQRKAIFEPAN